MKKIGIILSFIFIVGCGTTTTEPSERFVDSNAGGIHEYSIVTDKKTGCEYLMIQRGSGKVAIGGLAPLLDENGKPTGCHIQSH